MESALDGDSSFDEVLAPLHHGRRIGVIAAMAVAAAASFFGLWQWLALPTDAIGLVATLVGGWPIWLEAWGAIRQRQINMEITMAMGVVAALVVGQFATAAVIVSFTLFSMYLEDLTKSRGKRALEALLRAAPDTATVMRGGRWIDGPAAGVRSGERVLVRSGAAIPVDGRVLGGTSSVNEAAITGEPFAREKRAGDLVFAGTTNGNGTLELEALRSGTDTTFARIVRLVREAGERRGATQRLADRIAQGIVYIVLCVALVTWFVTREPLTVVSVILVAGACGVAAGTPLAILATIARNARRGVILRGGETVEWLARIDTVVFDKTGTLTLGEPIVERVVTFGGRDQKEFIASVAALEQGSDHPIARAVVRAHPPAAVAAGVQYVAGRGVAGEIAGARISVGNGAFLEERGVAVTPEARQLVEQANADGKLVVLGAIGGTLAGAVVLSDELRPEAVSSLERMRTAGLQLVMLTGDRETPALEIARRVGIGEVHARLLPEDKLKLVQRLKSSGRRVCFVGDGINDAPALAEAHVGAALRSGTEAALETADILLMNNDLSRLSDALFESRRAQGVILFNFAGTLTVDLAGIALAALGLLGPLAAALVHVGSELAFILNSARLFAERRERAARVASDGVARPTRQPVS
jgi:heavy metal translocating P-type ATPase